MSPTKVLETISVLSEEELDDLLELELELELELDLVRLEEAADSEECLGRCLLKLGSTQPVKSTEAEITRMKNFFIVHLFYFLFVTV